MEPQKAKPKTLLDYVNPTSRQREFLDAIKKHRFVLFGGAAGPGKSYILRWSLVLWLISLFKTYGLRRVHVALFCEDYPSLYDRQISKIETEFPSWLGRIRRTDTREFILNDNYGGGSILLRNLDDPAKYLSAEFAAVAVDELTRNEQKIFDFLRLRLRWPGVERPLFLGATNPGGIGHQWVKNYWKDKKFPVELLPLANEFAFVQALPQDNPHLTKQYWSDLATLPEDMRKAYLSGDWNLLAGKFFKCFSEERHVIEPPKLEPWYPRWISGDWGFNHPACFYWHARCDDGRIVTYRELWGREMDEEKLGEVLSAASGGERIKYLFLGADAWAKRRKNERPIAEQIDEGLRGLPPCTRADDDRIGGARLMYHLLDADMWQISKSCEKLVACLPDMIRDEDNLEDVLKVDWNNSQLGDDPYDAARYGLKSYLAEGVVPAAIVAQERVKEFAKSRGVETVEELDLNTVAQLSRRAMYQIQKQRAARRGGLGRVWRPQS